MTGLHEALDDVAAEITPIDPPVELAMRLGHKKRHRRRMTAITGTAGAMALTAAAVFGIPALTGPASTPTHTLGAAKGAAIPLARPVLLESQGNAGEYGDASLVNPATLRLFQQLTCTPAPSGLGGAVTNDAWKATVGYTAAQWNAAGSEIVSCDASGTKYVLGKAVILDSQVTSATARHLQNTGQWAVDVTLNSAATTAFAQLTTSQATRYYPASRSNWNDAVLASTAFVINGNVQCAPITAGPITSGRLQIAGTGTIGITKAQADALAAQLS